MIDGFEHETKPLTEEEMNLLPIIIRGLRTKVGADNAIFGAEICKKMTAAGYKLTEPRPHDQRGADH